LLAFDEVVHSFPPSENNFFVALGYSKLNQIRKKKYLEAKQLGYRLTSFVSAKACVLTQNPVGDNSFILENNTIQPFVTVGNNVTLWSGNHIGHHSTIGDHSFIASHVVVSGGVVIGEQCFIGVNATLRDHIRIGDRCVIGAGALMLADAAQDGLYAEQGTPRSRVPSSRLKSL
jgi:sugar O-acyltransferase (sialic acid O-acetyltransferase NeuD family)